MISHIAKKCGVRTAPNGMVSVSARPQCARQARRPRSVIKTTRYVRVVAAAAPELGTQTICVPAKSLEKDTLQRLDGTIKLDKPRVVVLGSGWASMAMIKALPADIKHKYDVVVVSPRNYFLYTPLLPAVAAGTVEELSIVEPVRTLVNGKATYYEATANSIDPVRKELVASFPAAEGGGKHECFKIKYDLLAIGVGSVNNTFGIPGVEQHCQMMKTVEDARKLRVRVSKVFERAALPNTSAEERKQLLSFVIVGGGPTGVEVAAELQDMIHEDLKRLYPELMSDVKVRVVELADHLLDTYNRKIGDFTARQFKREGIDLVLNCRVVGVTDGNIRVVDASGSELNIPYGSCVWATGIAMSPLVKQLQELFPNEQTHFRCVYTDDHLRVKGSDGSIWAFGDAATIHHPKALDLADSLFAQADEDKDGCVSLRQLKRLLHAACKEDSTFQEHVNYLDAKSNRFNITVSRVLSGLQHSSKGSSSPAGSVDPDVLLQDHDKLSREEFRAVLEHVDRALCALPATAQVAKQQGEYLASLLVSGHYSPIEGKLQLPAQDGPFRYFHKGSLAYVGEDRAVMDVPVLGAIVGWEAGFMWRSYETIAQISPRNQVMVFVNWVRTKLFGRNISNV